MTYTLAMAADQEIRIADDGVAEVSMTGARANLTRLIRMVREGATRAAAFTERKERRVYVLAPAAYEEVHRNRPLVQAFEHMPESEREQVLKLLRPYWP